MEKKSKIAIIGGGIGGLSTAISLLQNGFSPEVYEKSYSSKPLGAGIILAVNAMRVMHKWGVSDQLIKNGFPLNKFQIETYTGESLMKMDIKSYEFKYGVPSVGLHRHALHQTLLDQIPKSCLHSGKSGVQLIENNDKVEIYFENAEPVLADLVIVADGLRSKLRSQFFPNESLRYSGESGWRGVADWVMPADAPFVERWAPHIRFGVFQSCSTQVCWYSSQNTPPDTLPKDGVVAKKMLKNLLAEFSNPVIDVLDNTDPSTIIRTDLYDKKPAKSWSKGRIVFLGDSIHPTTPNLGQGAGMAIESAFVLGQALSQYSYQEAFTRYENIRRPRTRRVTQDSFRFGKLAQIENPFLYQIRNVMVKALSRPPFLGFQEKNMDRLWRGIF